jgi:hypothetical protein
MNPFASARILGICITSVVMLVAVSITFHTVSKWRADSAALAACDGLARSATASDPGTACVAMISGVLMLGKASAACDSGLIRGDDFLVQASCLASVKRVIAERNVRAGEVKDRDVQIDGLIKSRNQDVARAEARGLSQARMKRNADTALDTAPRDPGGRLVCGADCLRQLGGEPPDPGT